uniref:Alcohol acetyltransferase n=1 Tax=Kalmanozyma brasiliensis (strain GHG001) TaxID=1365824 RepID=V5EX02_KALBG
MATLHEGRTDIFYRIPLNCPADAYEQLVRRLPLVWALLCRRHPMLGAHVETRTPDGSALDPEEAASKRNAGEASQDGSSSFEPHFVFDLPETTSELLEQASRRVVIVSDAWQDRLASRSDDNASRDEAVVAWLDQQGQVSFDLILCAAHCISDGLSISSLAGELVQVLASSQLPEELPEVVSEAEVSVVVPGAYTARYSSISGDMQQALISGLFDSAAPRGKMIGNDSLDETHFASLLPPSIEATYPELLPAAPAVSSDHPSRLARLRWFWTIRRVICQIRAANAEKAILSDFKANRTDKNVKEPWWGAQTKWSIVRLSAQDTSSLTKLAKRKGVRVGSLLYAVAACALNTLEIKHASPQGRVEQPTTTVMGFPFSVRRFLDARAAVDALQPANAQDPLLPPSSLGVKLGFNGVSLPPASVFSLPEMPASDATQLSAFHVAQLWQVARQVQKQFNGIFREPRFMHADGFLMGLERETRFRKSGVKDVFQVFKDDEADREAQGVAGEDERRPGLTKKNMQGPGSSLNFSMVGLLDPVLPSKLDLPFGASKGSGALEVREGLLFGVRTRAGEAFGTSFTFRGQLNLELGHDTVVWDTAKVEEYLRLMKYIIEAMVAFEQGRR